MAACFHEPATNDTSIGAEESESGAEEESGEDSSGGGVVEGQLLDNASFEEWTGELPLRWSPIFGDATREVVDVAEGASALNVYGFWPGAELEAAWEIQQVVAQPIEQGEELLFSAAMKYLAGPGDVPEVLVTVDEIAYPVALVGWSAGGWVQVEGTVVPNVSDVAIEVRVKGFRPDQEILLDDLVLARI